jgi:DNA-binding NarL/FixJ family response regulator
VIDVLSDRPYERAYAQFRHAEAHLAQAQPDQLAAGRSLAAARQAAVALHARPLLDAIDAVVLRADIPVAGIAEPIAETEAGVVLTKREREVLGQLRLGMTNRKIGRALGMTEKTASVHVSNILAKLGVANRTAAAAVAQQLGIG